MKFKKEYIKVNKGIASVGFEPNGTVSSYFRFVPGKKGFTLERTDYWDESRYFMVVDKHNPTVAIPSKIMNGYGINPEYDVIPAIREGDGALSFIIAPVSDVPAPAKIIHQEPFYPCLDLDKTQDSKVYTDYGGIFISGKWDHILISVYMDQQLFIRVQEAKPEHHDIADYDELVSIYGNMLSGLKRGENICFRYDLCGNMRIPLIKPFRDMARINGRGRLMVLYNCGDELILTPPLDHCEICGEEIRYEEELPEDMLVAHEAKERVDDLRQLMISLDELTKKVKLLKEQKDAAEKKAEAATARADASEAKNAQIADILKRVAAL